MKDIKRLLPGLLISIIVIAAILYFVDFKVVVEAIRQADYRLVAASAVLSFLWMFNRAKVWQTLLRDKPKYIDVLFAASEGYLLNAFLPFRLGEVGRAFLLSRKSGMTFSEILPTIIIERVVDLAFSAAILLAALPYLADTQGSERIGYIVGGVVLFGLGMMYVLARNNKWALDIFHTLSVRWPFLQKLGGSFLESFFEGLSVLTNGWLFIRFLFWMTLNWIVALASYYLITLAFFPQAQPGWTLLILGAAAFGGAVPALPGGLGTFEGAVSGALFILTGDQSTSLAVALTARLYNYLNSGVIGGIGLMREGQTLSGVYQQLRNMRTGEKPEEKKVMFPLYDTVRSRKFPIVNWTLIILCGLAFYYEWQLGEPGLNRFIHTWGLVPSRLSTTPTDTWDTVFSSMFLHGGWFHILSNMWILVIFGDNIEERFGSIRYLFFYLLSGVAAALLEVYISPSSSIPTIGASGAIAGVLGAYLIQFPKARVASLVPIFFIFTIVELPAVVFLGFWFVLQLFSGWLFLQGADVSGIAWWAHIGGFVFGMLTSFLFVRRRY